MVANLKSIISRKFSNIGYFMADQITTMFIAWNDKIKI